MKIGEYLRAKYERLNGIVSITRVECKILGIDYPLRSGWFAEHQLREITAEQEAQLSEAMEKKRGKKAKRYAKAAIKFLHSELPLGPDEASHIRDISRAW